MAPGMQNFIFSPEDNILESCLGFIVQFFAFAVLIGPLVPEPNTGGPGNCLGEGVGGTPQNRKNDYPIKGMALRDLTLPMTLNEGIGLLTKDP